RLTELDLVLVKVVPALEVGVFHTALVEQVDNTLFGGVDRRPPVALAVDDVLDRLHGVGLGVTDEADRSALDPAGGVHAGNDVVAALLERHALAVRDDTVALVERDTLERGPEVTDRTVEGLDGDLANFACSDNATLGI